MRLNLSVDSEGNAAYGDMMIKRADGKPTHCRDCGKPLGSIQVATGCRLCCECVEKLPPTATKPDKPDPSIA